MFRQLRHRQTKGAANSRVGANITAPHLDSTVMKTHFAMHVIALCRKLAAVSLTFAYLAPCWGGSLEDALLASSLVRSDLQGVQIAIKKGANLKGRLPHPDSPGVKKTAVLLALGALFRADDLKTTKEVERILRTIFAAGAELNGDRDEMFIPIARGTPSILKLLLDNGSNPHVRIYGYSPTQLAIKYKKDDLLPVLAVRGATSVSDEEAAQIRFVHAALRQDWGEMKQALSAGANVNQPDAANHYAIVQLFSMPLIEPIGYDCVKWLLLEMNADPRLMDGGENATSATHQVIANNSFKQEDFFTTAAIVAMLLERGADVSALDAIGRTPLHYAAESGNYLAVEVLLRNTAKLSTRDSWSRTPLDLAKSREVITLLRNFGAKE